jgi:hypothetical protein
LVNRFRERHRIGGRRKVKSRKVQILKIENMMLKKKKECKRKEGQGDTCERL